MKLLFSVNFDVGKVEKYYFCVALRVNDDCGDGETAGNVTINYYK